MTPQLAEQAKRFYADGYSLAVTRTPDM